MLKSEPTECHTPFYTRRELVIQGAYRRVDRELMTPWCFMCTHVGLDVTNCEGRRVRYRGIKFEGSPQDVFWRFFEPDIRRVILEQIDATLTESKNHPQFIDQALDETAVLLHRFVKQVYERMAQIDRNLRGRGYPSRVELRPVGNEIDNMIVEIDRHVLDSKRLAKGTPPKNGDAGTGKHKKPPPRVNKTKCSKQRQGGGRPPINKAEEDKRRKFYEEVKDRKNTNGEPMKTVAEDWGISEKEGKAWMQWNRDQQKT